MFSGMGLGRWAAVAICLGLGACSERGQPAVSFVDDRAGLMTAAERAGISAWHAALLARYDIDYRVLTVAGADDLAGLAVRQFEQAGVGSLSRSGRGLLLVVDPVRGRVRLEVARELEGLFVDAFVAFIEREQMAPYFAAGRVGDGIVAASELIAGRAEAAVGAAALQDRDVAATSAGGGAESVAGVGGGYQRPTARTATDTRAQAAPLDTVAAYLAAMAAQDASPELDLYAVATRRMLAGHVTTRAQMDNLVRSYRDCPQPRVREQGGYAVIDHPGDPGGCAPWFLERGTDGLWRLDLLTMQRTIRFDTRNHWRVAAPEALGGYAFAFGD
jgi:uncharacterized protein